MSGWESKGERYGAQIKWNAIEHSPIPIESVEYWARRFHACELWVLYVSLWINFIFREQRYECSEILRGRSKYNCTYLMRQYDEYKTNYHIAKRIWRKRYYSYCIKDASVRLAWKKDLSFIHHEWLIWLMSSVTVFPCNSLKQSVQVHACAFFAALLSWIWKPQLLLHIHYFHQGEC